jgi:hypothetical protein
MRPRPFLSYVKVFLSVMSIGLAAKMYNPLCQNGCSNSDLKFSVK